jgi:hypothetical protein
MAARPLLDLNSVSENDMTRSEPHGVQFAVKMGFKTVAISCASGMHGASSAKIRTRPRCTFSTTTTG